MIARVRAVITRLRDMASWPVFTQEMRIRQRGTKPFAIMFVYAAVLSGLAVFVLGVIAPQTGYIDPNSMERHGRELFAVLSFAQLVMIALIVPAYSAGAVSAERDRGTIDLLAVTPLSSPEIVTQKLAAALAQAVMLVIVSLPVVAVVFLLGGVSPLEIVGAYAVLLLTAAGFGALGLLCSCQFKSAKTSTFTAYLTVLAFLAGVPLLGVLLNSMHRYSVGADSFGVAVAGAYAFVGGVLALFVYAVASSIAKRRLRQWQVRALRIAVFGAVYALVLLALGAPVTWNALFGSLFSYGQGLFLPLVVNPFMAMAVIVFGDSFLPRQLVGYWPVAGTLVFAAGCAYLFRHLSTLRFEAMRRI